MKKIFKWLLFDINAACLLFSLYGICFAAFLVKNISILYLLNMVFAWAVFSLIINHRFEKKIDNITTASKVFIEATNYLERATYHVKCKGCGELHSYNGKTQVKHDFPL